MDKFKLAFFIVLSSFVISCEDLRFGDAFLEKPAGNEDNIDSVFARKVNAEQALVAVYATLPDFYSGQLSGKEFLESLTDLNNTSRDAGAVPKLYYSGQLTSSAAQGQLRFNYTSGGWPGIRKAWIFIENVDRVPDMTVEEKNIRKAEAKLIMAIHYFDMLRSFGGIPWVGRSYKPGDDMSDFHRMTVEETVGKITGLLDEAAYYLPWTTSSLDDGRMTKAAAMALKVRVLLFVASPLFNDDTPYMSGQAADELLVWYGNKDNRRWQDAVDAAEAFLEELKLRGGYALVDTGNPREDFRKAYFNRGNGEVLISTRARAKYPKGKNDDEAFFFATNDFGNANTTLDYVDMFQMSNGDEFDWNNPAHASYPFFDVNGDPVRDPRLYESVTVNGDDYQGRKAALWIGGVDRPTDAKTKTLAASGFCMRKFRQDIYSAAGKFYSFPYLRLPEIYLSYAEALNECGRSEEAYEYLNKVRRRVRMPDIEENSLTKEELREAILRERALEFGYEEVRFYDLVRWKREDIFKKKLRGLDIVSKDKGKTFEYRQFEIPVARCWQGAGWSPKWYLCPFPISEINKKHGLIQNPGW